MTTEMHGHEIEHGSSSGYEYTNHTYSCVNTGCHITASGEYGAHERIEELAKKFDCPRGPNRCMKCGTDIDPTGEICKTCKVELDVGERVFTGR